MNRRAKRLKRVLALLLAVIVFSEGVALDSFAAVRSSHMSEVSYESEVVVNETEAVTFLEESDTDTTMTTEENSSDSSSDISTDAADEGTSSSWNSVEESTVHSTEASTSNAAEDSTILSTEESELLSTEDLPVVLQENTLSDDTMVTVLSANNWFKVDSSNAVVKTPSDFAIGKMGAYEFALSFKFTPADIPQDMYDSVAAVFTIPSGFTVSKLPSLSDINTTKKINPDGSTTVICKAVSVGTTALLGQISVRQDAEKLLNGLKDTDG